MLLIIMNHPTTQTFSFSFFKDRIFDFLYKYTFFVLQEQEGATLLVSAKFTLLSKRNIYLQFEEVHISIPILLFEVVIFITNVFFRKICVIL